MADSQITRASLVFRLRDHQDADAWSQFAEVYEPLLKRFLQQKGLQAADVADITQEILQSVSSSIGKLNYDRSQGRFRNWLLTVARSKMIDHWKRTRRQPAGSGDSQVVELLNDSPDSAADVATWDQDYERRLFEWASQKIRDSFQEKTWQAFWKTTVDGVDSAIVAELLGMSVGAVYIAKSRVMTRLREVIQEVDHE